MDMVAECVQRTRDQTFHHAAAVGGREVVVNNTRRRCVLAA